MSNTKTITQKTNEVWSHTWDFSAVDTAISATVSSVVWAVQSGTTVTLGTETLADPLASVVITAANTKGRNCVTCTATYSDGQVGVYTLNISVVVPC